MRQINPEHIDALMQLVNNGPYFNLLAMRLCEVGIGCSKVEIDLEKKHLNPFGIVHGGVYSSLIDTATYFSAYCEMDENTGFTTLDLSVSNLLMIREGKIIAEGRSIKVGQSICLAEALVKDANGKLLAHGTSKLMVLNGKQSIEQAIKAMGYQPLPCKFVK